MRLSACVPSTSTATASAVTPSVSLAARSFSSSSSAQAKPRKQRNAADPLSLRRMPKFNFDDVPTLGHAILQRKREMLQYYRTIEFEIPKLAAFKQNYTPPSDAQILEFRFQHYQGEAHPASRKVVLTVPVQKLFASGLLQSPEAMHKLLLLAGPRFRPSKDASLTATTDNVKDVDGEIKISCESMPNERQNMKWCSDTFDALVAEANKSSPELNDLPLDPRPSLIREDKKRHYLRQNRATLRDFPKQWL
ncbi:hypothetical protein BCV70DRAFT_157974 [Testicularia cyperi]|uniref:Small ribosomal subunit protein mS35 mitochondrial conserved domain-containing protein n=1 Tax=Testicularia cyperi TaxID=1882483 RepID=A0A317XTV4_9BASI|nr:hypothetical protein BCV70DRAFT_157974 [Testicularia cyperi]